MRRQRLAICIFVLIGASLCEAQQLSSLYGEGCPTSEGVVPILGPISPPFIGNPAFGVYAGGLTPTASVTLLVSTRSTSLPIGGSGCRLLVGPSPLMQLPMPRTGPDAAELSFPLPHWPQLLGTSFYAQLGVLDSGSFATSPGLRVTLAAADESIGLISALTGPRYNLEGRLFFTGGSFDTQVTSEPVMMGGLGLERDWNYNTSVTVFDDQTGDALQQDHRHWTLGARLRGRGNLIRFATQTQRPGLAHVGPDGTWTTLFAPSPDRNWQFGGRVALSEDGTRLGTTSAVSGNYRFYMAATDDTPLQGSSPWTEITPPGVNRLWGTTPLMTEDWAVFFVQEQFGSPLRCFITPTDASAPTREIPVPLLGSGAAPTRLTLRWQSEEQLLFAIGDDFSHDDFYVFESATQSLSNITAFSTQTRIDIEPNFLTNSWSREGDAVLFQAQGELYVAHTDGSDAGQLGGQELSPDSVFSSTFRWFGLPTQVDYRRYVVFAGPDWQHTDLYDLAVDDAGNITATNVSGTSGETSAPFSVPGTIAPNYFGPSPDSHLYFERASAAHGFKDLVAVDLYDLQLINVTGSEFTVSGLPSYQGISQLSWTIDRKSSPEREPTFLVFHKEDQTWGLGQFDRLDPQSGSRLLATYPANGRSIDGFCYRSDGLQAAWTRGTSGGTVLEVMDFPDGNPMTVRSFSGEVADGSLRYVHETDPTLAYVVGTNDAKRPTDAQIHHTSVRTGLTTFVPQTPGEVQLLGTSDGQLGDPPCDFSVRVVETCTATDRDSVLYFYLGKPGTQVGNLDVVIHGNGPTFEDGTRTKTIPCLKDSHCFPIKAGSKVGKYHVSVGGKIFKDRIKVFRVTHVFRTNGTISPDNKFRLRRRMKDQGLGVARNTESPRSRNNAMELQVTVDPPDACGCVFDFKRTFEKKSYDDGNRRKFEGPGANDDETEQDETHEPSAAGHLYSTDWPGFTDVNGENGSSLEYHAHFTEWLEVKTLRKSQKSRMVTCLDPFAWESHLCLLFQGGNWVFHTEHCDISLGHDIPLDPYH
ncbi:MAG: hypothetical protein RL885_23060 [Planctomycetota bacterium]